MNGIILINKEQNFTSFDVVAIMRKLCQTKKIGHGGTLDPMATGVLPIFIGKATKAVDFASNSDKEYVAGFRLGITTDTQDITGRVLAEKNVHVNYAELSSACKEFMGEIQQIPPMYSAVKVNGQKLYDLARKGIEVERKSRSITIHTMEIISFDGVDGMVKVSCSKGTYIRTLLQDIGDFLGCGGVMTSLIRTKSGGFSVEDSITIGQARSLAEKQQLPTRLIPISAVFSDFPTINLDEKQSFLFANGVKLDGNRLGISLDYNGVYSVYNFQGKFVGLSQLDKDLSLKIIRQFSM